MKKALLFRNLLWFPFISIILFDATFKIQDKSYQIPQIHYIILSSLTVIYLSTFLFNKQA